jgi:sialate O-acetylesterase
LFAIHVAAALPAARADVSLAAIFTDHAVLQRGKPIPIWGKATPGETVTVSYREADASTTAGKDGSWRVELPAQQLGQPAELIATGTNRIVLKDVVVGEVWICSGQSNMAFAVEKSDHAAAEIASAGNPDIRVFQSALATPERPAENVSGTWVLSSPETAGKFTAVGYFFARELHQVLGVPIGIINSSVGGTPIEAWMSTDALAAFPDAIAATRAEAQKGKKARHAKNRPHLLYNGMIAPLMPYAIRGFLWYQGEGNAHTAERATAYGDLLNTLIVHWREGFGQGDVPFFFVQLPNFKTPAPESGLWTLLRASQSRALDLPNTGMAVTIDVGDPTDIHPKNKQPVGHRLALLALKEVYKQPVVAAGPALRTSEIHGRRVRLEFDQTIVIRPDEPGGLEIAGGDGKFLPARAVAEGKSVWIENAAVEEPKWVRYAWANNPVASLFNETGLPAAPFQLDLNIRLSPFDTDPP